MPDGKVALHFEEIAKAFSRQKVLNGVNLSLQGGEIVLLLGANGSGKSTLLRIAADLLRPDSGRRKVLLGERNATAQEVGYLGHNSMLYADLSVYENLAFFSQLSGGLAEALIDAWALQDIRNSLARDLSKGQLARLSLARAFLPAPSIVFLDEPTSALDERGVQILLREIGKVRELGGLVLIATHDIARLAAYAQRVLVLQQGKMACEEALGLGGSSAKALPFYHSINR
ncbi:MAG: heme ABC exporter ATP-binding protein CcmA [Oligoflexia bacterium]|nr:heme ABC exporter ATP-binding protein CcmA [Oligoflexia bacterium]